MDMKRMTARGSTIDSVSPSRNHNRIVSGMAARVLLALVISLLLIMAFFVTHVASP